MKIISDVAFVIGAGALIYGVYLVYPPAALIIGGGLVALFGYFTGAE